MPDYSRLRIDSETDKKFTIPVLFTQHKHGASCGVGVSEPPYGLGSAYNQYNVV